MTDHKRPHRLQAAAILAMTIDRTLVDCVDDTWFTGHARDAFFEIKVACGGNDVGTVQLDRFLASEFGVVRRKDERVRDALIRRLKLSADKRELMNDYKRKLFQLPKSEHEPKDGADS